MRGAGVAKAKETPKWLCIDHYKSPLMSHQLRIDFVSDVSCPWCIIGLRGLETALERMADVVTADIHFQPFELNPSMAPEGQNIVEHIGEKYGSTKEQSATTRRMIRERAAELGFAMVMDDASRIYNTFDAHRLLHWAGLEGSQIELKHALFEAYFSDGRDPSDPEVLLSIVGAVGLDAEVARDVLETDLYAEEVRDAEKLWQERGINSVPAVIVNERYLISGGLPPDAFEEALRGIAAKL